MTAAHPRHSPTRSTSGFTLAEVLVATVILGLVISTVSMILRTAIRAWRVGHDMDEVTQTARLTRDVINRDLNALVYESQSQYNKAFLGQLVQAGQLYANGYETSHGILDLDDRFDFSKMVMPLDLSFQVKNGGGDAGAAKGVSPGSAGDNDAGAQDAGDGANDRLTFVRARESQESGDPTGWKLRRVTYFVHDRTLYRQENDPYGFRPGQYEESFYNGTSVLVAMAQYFMKSGGNDYVKDDAGKDVVAPADHSLLPDPFEDAEPLCDGVESFRVACGYFKGGKWEETSHWDSSARQYRTPTTFKKIDASMSVDVVKMVHRQDYVVADGVPSTIIGRGRPDDLPAYLVLKLSMRGPIGVGLARRHAFFFSLPMAQEMDIFKARGENGIVDAEAGVVPGVNLQVPGDASEPEQ
jgi:prepilin-type N-terminal cleavage/methylation domain-containing protein